MPDMILAEGKTKQVIQVLNEPDAVLLRAKDDITAGDGAKHDVIPGKGEWATTTTCNVFDVLKHLRKPLPIAYIGRADATSFLARRCSMLPFEVVIRRAPFGSYLKRHPEVQKGKDFVDLKCEFFLKTTGKRFGYYGFPVDDPLLIFNKGQGGVAYIYDPRVPAQDGYLMQIPIGEIIDPSLQTKEMEAHNDVGMLFWMMKDYASQAFILIEDEWRKLGGRLVDWKVEFGVDSQGNLLLADVIDNDSWRVIFNGEHIDKQRYRDGSSLEDVADRYKYVAELTSRFS